jgi:hypothetical protein
VTDDIDNKHDNDINTNINNNTNGGPSRILLLQGLVSTIDLGSRSENRLSGSVAAAAAAVSSGL